MRHIANVSFGKDSLAMLLLLIEKQYPLDEVLFFDTGWEFNSIYRLRNKIKPMLENKGIKFTELKPAKPFDYLMFEHQTKAVKQATVGVAASAVGERHIKSPRLISMARTLLYISASPQTKPRGLKKSTAAIKHFRLPNGI